MEPEGITVSAFAYTVLRMNVLRPAGISAKACVSRIQHQPGTGGFFRKLLFICSFPILFHGIRQGTEMEIITAYNLNGMCSIGKNGKSRVLMAAALTRYHERNVLFCHGRSVKTRQCCVFSVCIRIFCSSWSP